jgi:hypothetical protein
MQWVAGHRNFIPFKPHEKTKDLLLLSDYPQGFSKDGNLLPE